MKYSQLTALGVLVEGGGSREGESREEEEKNRERGEEGEREKGREGEREKRRREGGKMKEEEREERGREVEGRREEERERKGGGRRREREREGREGGRKEEGRRVCAHVHEVHGYIPLPLFKPIIHAACETMAILTSHTHTQPINSVEKELNVS